MNPPIGFPPGTIYNITGIINSNPGVVTLSTLNLPGSFYIVNGTVLTISGVLGMRQVNGNRYNIGNVNNTAMTFSLFDAYYNPVDTTQFGVYTGSGEINIISFPAQAGQPPGLMYNNEPITI